MKVVDIFSRIPKHLDLNFSDFSTILYGIYKFAVFETKEKENELLHLGPWKFVSSQGRSLADGGWAVLGFPASRLAGGEG